MIPKRDLTQASPPTPSTFWEQPEEEEKVIKALILRGPHAASPGVEGGSRPEVERGCLYCSKGDFSTSWQPPVHKRVCLGGEGRVCLGGEGMSLIAPVVVGRGKQK